MVLFSKSFPPVKCLGRSSLVTVCPIRGEGAKTTAAPPAAPYCAASRCVIARTFAAIPSAVTLTAFSMVGA
jgi:hypothetical protein